MNMLYQHMNCNIVEYWRDHESLLHPLSEIALKYIPIMIPATSVPSERIFSKAGQIMSARQNLTDFGPMYNCNLFTILSMFFQYLNDHTCTCEDKFHNRRVTSRYTARLQTSAQCIQGFWFFYTKLLGMVAGFVCNLMV